MPVELKDRCLNCGKEYSDELWGAHCDCNSPYVVHKILCSRCGISLLGYIGDDDYCGLDKIVCSICMKGER